MHCAPPIGWLVGDDEQLTGDDDAMTVMTRHDILIKGSTLIDIEGIILMHIIVIGVNDSRCVYFNEIE